MKNYVIYTRLLEVLGIERYIFPNKKVLTNTLLFLGYVKSPLFFSLQI